jgi:ABC-type phosphate transport system substrate-binding protein
MNLRIVIVVLLGCLAASVGSAQVSAPAYRVVVNPRNPVTSVDRAWVTQAFLKKATSWRNGPPLRPVDLQSSSSIRRQFTEEMIGRSVVAVKSYWQQMIFSGRALPPPELTTDAEVLHYVLQHPGAIGYVSGGADVRAVKVLVVK